MQDRRRVFNQLQNPTKCPLATARCQFFIIGCVAAVVLIGGPRSAAAQEAIDASGTPASSEAEQFVGDAHGALPGVVTVGSASPVSIGGSVSAFAGYGFLGDILGRSDSHHQVAGQLAATVRLVDWFGIGVRFDGRYDKHDSTDGSDDGYVGDPRIVARATRAVSPKLHLGGQLNLWFPGSDAPSLVPSAISAEVLAIATLRLLGKPSASAPLTLNLNAGFRLDNSLESVRDPMVLSLSDRLALGVSESNAILFGAGLTYRAGPTEWLAEATYDYSTGGDALSPAHSPIEVRGGLRYFVADTVQLQAYLRTRLSKDPIVTETSPLVAVSPRFGGMAGLNFQFGGPSRGEKRLASSGDKIDTIEGATTPRLLEPAALRGRVISGGAPIAGATVRLSVGKVFETVTTTITGQYEFLEIALVDGSGLQAAVSVTSDGFVDATSSVQLEPGKQLTHDIEIERILPPGKIRGVVRDFRGQPVLAKVTILQSESSSKSNSTGREKATEITADANGSFSVDVAPGEYEVVVEHRNYRAQRKQVKVEKGLVTILNIDLQKP